MPRTLVQCCPPLAPQVHETLLHVLLDVVPSGAAAPRSAVFLAPPFGCPWEKWPSTARLTRTSSRVSYTSLSAVSLPRVSLAPAVLHEAIALRAVGRNSCSEVVKLQGMDDGFEAADGPRRRATLASRCAGRRLSRTGTVEGACVMRDGHLYQNTFLQSLDHEALMAQAVGEASCPSARAKSPSGRTEAWGWCPGQ